MSDQTKVRIVSDGTPGGTRVLVDGDRELPATYVKLEIDARGNATCVVHLAAGLEYEGPTTFRLPDDAAKQLPVAGVPKILTKDARRRLDELTRSYTTGRSLLEDANDKIADGDRKR